MRESSLANRRWPEKGTKRGEEHIRHEHRLILIVRKAQGLYSAMMHSQGRFGDAPADFCCVVRDYDRLLGKDGQYLRYEYLRYVFQIQFWVFPTETQFKRGMQSEGHVGAFARVAAMPALYSLKRDLVWGFVIYPFVMKNNNTPISQNRNKTI